MITRRIAVCAVPAKVSAAQDYLRFAEVCRAGGPQSMNCEMPLSTTRDLTPREQRVYEHALEVLRLYFSGECDFAPQHPLDDDKPPSRELQDPNDESEYGK